MLRSARHLGEVLGLGALLVLVPLATLGSTLVICDLLGLPARVAEVLGASLGLLATAVVAVGLVLSARRGRPVESGTPDDPLCLRAEIEELPVWVGRASEVGAQGGVLLLAGSVLAEVSISIWAALGAARAAQVAAGYVTLVAAVSAGVALLVRVRRLEQRDAARVAAEMSRAVPGLELAGQPRSTTSGGTASLAWSRSRLASAAEHERRRAAARARPARWAASP